MNLVFDILATLIVGVAVIIGFEIAYDESRHINLGIAGCFFIALAGSAVSAFDVDNYGWDNFLSALLMAAIPAVIGIICLLIWRKDF